MRFAVNYAVKQAPRTSWFAIVGAPRCGTTSLARYLRGHPDIQFSTPKEPHFFSRLDLTEMNSEEVATIIRENYLECFFPNASGSVLAEASVSYLYAPERLLPVLNVWPDAKFIIAVRNPLEMLPSLHQRHFYNGDETVRDFGRAWALVHERRLGKRVPKSCVDPRLLDYREIGLLGKHVERFFEVVGRNRCFVSVFDDLVTNPRRQYREILYFVGLPWDDQSSFAVHRASLDVKLPSLQRLLKRPPKPVHAFLASNADVRRESSLDGSRVAPVLTPGALMKIRKRLLAWNRTSASPPHLSAELRSEIVNEVREDVAELSAVIRRDLNHWLA